MKRQRKPSKKKSNQQKKQRKLGFYFSAPVEEKEVVEEKEGQVVAAVEEKEVIKVAGPAPAQPVEPVRKEAKKEKQTTLSSSGSVLKTSPPIPPPPPAAPKVGDPNFYAYHINKARQGSSLSKNKVSHVLPAGEGKPQPFKGDTKNKLREQLRFWLEDWAKAEPTMASQLLNPVLSASNDLLDFDKSGTQNWLSCSCCGYLKLTTVNEYRKHLAGAHHNKQFSFNLKSGTYQGQKVTVLLSHSVLSMFFVR
jgi:hypothetical protein